jgi:hypothetical protein
MSAVFGCTSRRLACVGRDDPAQLAIAPDRAVPNGPEIDFQHVLPDVSTAMWARVVRHARAITFQLVELAVTGPMVRAVLAAIRRLRAPPSCA